MLYVDNRIRMRETGVLIDQKLLHFKPTVLRFRPAYLKCLLAAAYSSDQSVHFSYPTGKKGTRTAEFAACRSS